MSIYSAFSKEDVSEDRKRVLTAYLYSHWDVLDGDLQIGCLPAEPNQSLAGHQLDLMPSNIYSIRKYNNSLWA